MELVSLAQDVLQSAAEHAASYRLGQSALRHLDRVLWVVEKCARWAVPPPLDQEERPQPELVRPLPWVLFLAMLVTLRVTRESISLVNLVMGKPPLRSADVVTYIQSKRRYLRTLKYQGGRVLRAHSQGPQGPRGPGPQLRALLQLCLCFRRPQPTLCTNNNTSANTDEIMVVKHSKRRQLASSPPPGEATYERLIENMMIELNADSDDDSSFTLTNATSIKSDRSDTQDSDQDTVFQQETVQQDITTTEPTHCSTPTKHNSDGRNDTLNDSDEIEADITGGDSVVCHNDSPKTDGVEVHPTNDICTEDMNEVGNEKALNNTSEVGSTHAPPNKEVTEFENNEAKTESEKSNGTDTNTITVDKEKETSNIRDENRTEQNTSGEDNFLPSPDDTVIAPKEDTQNFLRDERMPHRSPKNEKLANGRTVKSVSAKKGIHERRDVPVTSNNSF